MFSNRMMIEMPCNILTNFCSKSWKSKDLRFSHILIALLIIFFSASDSYSQLLPGETKSKTVKPRNDGDGLAGGMFAGVTVKTANTLGQWGFDVGAQFGGMLSDHFGLGGGLYTLFTQNVKILPSQPYFLRLSYGGIEPRFVFKFGKIAFHTKLHLGLGFAGYSDNVNFDILGDLDGDWIFLGEPSLGISYVIDESLWLTFDAGWRVTGGVDFRTISAEDLNGAVFSITLKTFMY
jgi:hypothetical protein